MYTNTYLSIYLYVYIFSKSISISVCVRAYMVCPFFAERVLSNHEPPKTIPVANHDLGRMGTRGARGTGR